MKIITHTDIRNLIIFARKEMGIYNLVYKKCKKLYFIILFLVTILMLLLIVFLYNFFVNKKIINLIVYSCIIVAVISLVLLYLLNTRTRRFRNQIQKNRVYILENYYKSKKYKSNEIILINDLLQQRINNIQSNNIKIYVIIISLIFPIWELYTDKLSEKMLFIELIVFLVPRVLFISIFILILFPVYNFIRMQIIENLTVLNNVYVMNNIIYLNSYIIEKFSKKEKGKNGKRRK